MEPSESSTLSDGFNYAASRETKVVVGRSGGPRAVAAFAVPTRVSPASGLACYAVLTSDES